MVSSSLVNKNGKYEIDFEDFEKKASSPKCTAFILCNPHNPVGRVYTEEELRKMGEICNRHGVFVIADEIHSDLIAKGHKHVVYAKLGKEFEQNCAVCHAPSKTFNLAGLQLSCILIPNEKIREKFDAIQNRYSITSPNYFAPVAAKAAWKDGEDWLAAVYEYMFGNYEFIVDFCKKTWGDKVIVSPLEGTYLAWLDFRQLESDPDKLQDLVRKEAKVALDEGYIFGPEGAGFERINLACPRELIVELMERLAKVIK